MVRVLFLIQLRIENHFNSIELKQKITYTGACDEELFLHHQSPVFLCFVGVFEADWEAWVTRQQNDDAVVVVTHVTGMRTYSSRLIEDPKPFIRGRSRLI